MRNKTTLILLAAGAGALAFVIGQDALAKYEEPDYKVLKQVGNIEIREYPSTICATVEVDGVGKSAANQAFKILAGYIFGKNVTANKIAMTVPVTEVSTSSANIAMTVPVASVNCGKKMTMSFYMPSQYTMQDLPRPTDDRIAFIELAPAKYVVIKFSGVAGEGNIARQEADLLGYAKDHEINARGQIIRAFYNPPWTLPFLRRNELWLPIGESEAQETIAPRNARSISS